MFKILKDFCEPVRSTKYSAYVDLFSADDVIVGAGETKVIKLGVKLDMDFFESMFNPDKLDFKTAKVGGLYSDDELRIQKHQLHNFLKSHYLEVALRSSLAVKGLIIANGIGVIDLDYTNEIGLIVHNPTKIAYEKAEDTSGYVECDDNFIINKGDKVAQCTLKEHKGYLLGYESDVIRVLGFGSTGI